VAEITRQRTGQIVRAVFEILQDHPEGMQVQEIISRVERTLGLTEFEQSDYPNRPGVRRFDKIIRFSTISPVKAGWMTKSRSGVWTITEEGRQAYRDFPDAAQFMRQATKLYRAWKKAQPDVEPGSPEDVEGATASATMEEAQESAWTEIEQYIRAMPPYEFQELAAGLFRAMGYHVSWVAPPGPDRGIDIVAFTDPLGAEGPRIKAQVKRRSDKIGVDGLRSFMAVLAERDIGIFVSVGGFSPDAVTEARMHESRRLTLIDLERLVELWIDHYDRLDEIDRQRFPLQPVYFLSIED
jgi:restriction system protein